MNTPLGGIISVLPSLHHYQLTKYVTFSFVSSNIFYKTVNFELLCNVA